MPSDLAVVRLRVAESQTDTQFGYSSHQMGAIPLVDLNKINLVVPPWHVKL